MVGFVAIHAAPFQVDAASFVRDVMFYLVGASFLFYVYLSGEIFVWQAVGFVGFYVFFVGFVFWMDFGSGGGVEKGKVVVSEEEKDFLRVEIGASFKAEKEHRFSRVLRLYGKVKKSFTLASELLLLITVNGSGNLVCLKGFEVMMKSLFASVENEYCKQLKLDCCS